MKKIIFSIILLHALTPTLFSFTSLNKSEQSPNIFTQPIQRFDPKDYFKKQCAFCHNEKGKIGPPMSTVKLTYLKAYPDKKDFVEKMTNFVLNPNEKNRLITNNTGVYGVMPKEMFSDRDKIEKVILYIYSSIKVPKIENEKKSKKEIKEEKVITIKLNLTKGTDIGKYLNISKINFAYASAKLTDEMKKELDKIYILLKDNPSIKIEIINHTDARGSAKRNMQLSKKRANVIKNYLIQKGILPNRLIAKGAGESEIINRCKNGVKCSEEEHKQNRRCEFIII